MTTEELTKTEKIQTFILAIVQFCHILDFVVLMPLGPSLMHELSIGPAEFATLVSSYNFSAAFAGIVFGTFADRFDRKKLLLLSMLGFILGTLLCGLSYTYHYLLAARILTGAFGGILNANVYALSADLVSPLKRGKAMGIIVSAFSMASVLGVPLGLAIADKYNWHMTFYYIAVLAIVPIVMSFKYLPSLSHLIAPQKDKNFLKDFFKLLANQNYYIGYIFIMFVTMSMFLLIPFLSPIAVNNFGIETYEIKYMYLVGGLCTIISARLFGRFTDSYGAFRMLLIIALLSIPPILIYTHSGPMSLAAYISLGSVFMVFVSGRMVPTMTLLTHLPDHHHRGAFMGVLNAVRSLGSASGTLIGGLIIHEKVQGAPLTGADYASYLSVFLTFIFLVLAYFISQKLKRSGKIHK